MKFLKIIVLAAWVLLIALFAIPQNRTIAESAEPTGKELYKQNCRVCHEKDSPNGEFTPMSLTQDQWKAFFKNKFADKHKDVILKKESKKLLEYLTQKNIDTIQKYCVDHAADSEQPQTCSE